MAVVAHTRVRAGVRVWTGAVRFRENFVVRVHQQLNIGSRVQRHLVVGKQRPDTVNVAGIHPRHAHG